MSDVHLVKVWIFKKKNPLSLFELSWHFQTCFSCQILIKIILEAKEFIKTQKITVNNNDTPTKVDKNYKIV